MVPLPGEEVENAIAIILAAHGEKFPRLRGQGVKPHEEDDHRRFFAKLLVEHLRRANVRFFRRAIDTCNFMLNSGCFPEHKR